MTEKITKQIMPKIVIGVYILMIAFAPVFITQAEAPDPVSIIESFVSDLDIRAEKIDAYFARYNLPLSGHGEDFVAAADTYGIDWRLLAAISFIESTGGKFACKKAAYSAFGWGSCKINFDSYKHAIDVVSKNLGGHNPNTEIHYGGKNTREILEAYNPPEIVPDYADKVMKQMDIIEKMVV